MLEGASLATLNRGVQATFGQTDGVAQLCETQEVHAYMYAYHY
jgi:hypothetical protein